MPSRPAWKRASTNLNAFPSSTGVKHGEPSISELANKGSGDKMFTKPTPRSLLLSESSDLAAR